MAQETETPAMELAMVSCASCDLMFMASERRQTCPTCGGEAAGPYFEFVLDESGLHQKDGALPGMAPPAEPATEEEETAPPVPVPLTGGEVPVVEGIKLPPSDVFPLAIESYLRGGEATEDDLRDLLIDLGAEREDAVTAVGRIMAVRVLLCDLAGAGLEPVAEAEVEVSPEAAPEPSSEGGNGSETS